MTNHDPLEYIRGIQQILISDKKKIGFLFGAGSSLAYKNEKSLTVPAIGKMTSEIIKEVGLNNDKYKVALEEIKEELGEYGFNVETILSNLEQKFTFIGKGELNTLNKSEFASLIKEIKKEVREKVSVHNIQLCDVVTNSCYAKNDTQNGIMPLEVLITF